MILQLLFDDKFGDYAIEQFARFGNEVHFVFLCNDANITPKYIKKFEATSVVAYSTPEYQALLDSLGNYNAVITHGLFDQMQYDIIRHLPSHTKLAWVLWGAEVYARSNRFTKNLSKTSRAFYYAHLLKGKIKGKKKKNTNVPMDVLQRIDYLLGSSTELYEDVCKFLNKPTLKHLTYSYFTVEDLVGKDLLLEHIRGNNILLNNSSCVEANHLNALWKLWRSGLSADSKLIIPLSYGDIWFGRIIERVAKLLFKDKCVTLHDFMPRNEYNKIVVTCGTFISNHYRPNAFGNILTALWLGAQVYVSKYNVQTKFLLRLGFKINIIEEGFKPQGKGATMVLDENEILKHREIILANYGKEVMDRNVDNIFQELNR